VTQNTTATGVRSPTNGQWFNQTSDIDMAGCQWDGPIGDYNTTYGSSGLHTFQGYYNGGGHAIRNLTVDSLTNYGGLFGRISQDGITGTGGVVVEDLGVAITVTGDDQYAGGLVGNLYVGSLSNVYSTGSVSSTLAYGDVGGLVGKIYTNYLPQVTINNSYSTASVAMPNAGFSNSHAGGLVGAIEHTLSDDSVQFNNSYATGAVSASGSIAGIGGLLGKDWGSGDPADFATSFFDTQTSYPTSPVGTGKTTAQLTTAATYTTAPAAWSITDGFSASTTWSICSGVNSDYPFLTSFYAVSPCASTSPTPTFDTPVSTLDGFTVNVTNYDDSYNWTPSVTTGAVVAGTASGSTLPLIVTGLAAGADDTITVTTTRSGYTNGSATVMGSALEAALTPTFDTPVSTSTGYTVNVTNYDDSYTWTPSVNSGSVSAGTASGSTLPLTITSLSPGASATTTVATTRTGYAPGQAQVIGVALIPRASASPTSINFGVQTVGSPSAAQTITVTSTGTDDLTFGGSAVTITGADSAMFSDDTDTCSGQTVTPSNTCTIEVTFTPTSTGAKSATLSIASNDPASPTTIALSGGQNPTPPTPPTPTKPSAPTNVSGTAGDGQVSVTWQAPADSGTYAITDYQVTASPGGATCMTTAPTLACTIDGLTNGTAYTFTVKALSGAGWGANSAPSAPVTPQAPRNPTITITGSRSQDNDKRVYADGITTDLVGEVVQARVHLAGEEDYYNGSRRTVSDDGTFRWTRKTNKKVYLYFRHDETRSNRIVISPR
jgi:hypothetical protein